MYTVVSLADVFAQPPTYDFTTEQCGSGFAEYYMYNGEKRLNRLFSTNPADYLNII